MKYLLLVSISLFVNSISYSQLSGNDSLAYIKEIESQRKEKNKEYKKNSKPIPPEYKKGFKQLDYFPIDVNYRLHAIFHKSKDEKPFAMETTTKRKPMYIKYGTITFIVDSVEYKLAVYQNVVGAKLESYDGKLFIPFKDKTSKLETNINGRYLDFWIPDSEDVIIDFNLASNPWCVYNEHFSCPIPPEENILPIPIQAGEKDFMYGH